jgi:hypothetical protein
LPSVGFLPKARDAHQFADRQWTETKHTLDRIFEKDGVFYGTEIKNRLSHISQEQLYTKLSMCDTLHLRPLFIARWMPKSYVYELFQKGGFALLMKFQFHPFGSESVAATVRGRLKLPVARPRGDWKMAHSRDSSSSTTALRTHRPICIHTGTFLTLSFL